MYRVLDCIFTLHDLRLVALAAMLCLFACATAMTMLARARDHSGRARMTWAAAAGIVSGCGIWAMHFVAMLAFDPGFRVGFEIAPTVISMAVSIALCGAGFAIALTRGGEKANALVAGGGVTGLAIAGMHEVGMSGMVIPADIHRDLPFAITGIAIGIVLTALAFWIAFRGNSRRHYMWGAAFFALAICSIHFSSMASVTLHYNPTIPAPEAIISPLSLAIAVTACASLIVALGCAGAIFDHHLAEVNRGEQQRLRTHVAELQVTKSNLESTGKKLKMALANAASASHAKSEFLASMSHELRTPLNAIIGFSEVMQVETFGPLGSPRYKEYAGDIHDSGTHLLALINDILDLSRLDAGALTLDETDFSLRDAVAQSLKMISPQAGNKGVALLEDLPAEMPMIHADERRIKQVLINLLANAVKFTPSGGSITVRGQMEERGLAIAVIDTGVGIAPENIARALEPFNQIDSSVSREHGGAGLGLPLSSQMMQLHGGSLTLESTLSVGTSVTVRLPASRFVVPKALSAAE